jgi:hypothetical protein
MSAQFNDKQVQKWNSLLILFLTDLQRSLPENALVSQANDFVSALVALQPGNTDVVDQFMSAMQNAADFIAARNTDIFARASEVSAMITKEDAIVIYKELTEADRAVVWKYITKLYAVGKKAAPHLVREDDFDFNNLTPASPIHGIITTVKSAMPKKKQTKEERLIAIKQANEVTAPKPSGLITTAFRQMALSMLTTVHDDCGNDPDVQGMCSQMKAFIESSAEEDPFCSKLIAATAQFYPDDTAQQLVMDTESAIRTYGFPLIPGGPELASSVLDTALDSAVIIAAVMQFGTVYVTLTSLDDTAITKMEALAAKFYSKVESGEIEFGDNLDPMAMLSTLTQSDMSQDIMDLMNGV